MISYLQYRLGYPHLSIKWVGGREHSNRLLNFSKFSLIASVGLATGIDIETTTWRFLVCFSQVFYVLGTLKKIRCVNGGVLWYMPQSSGGTQCCICGKLILYKSCTGFVLYTSLCVEHARQMFILCHYLGTQHQCL